MGLFARIILWGLLLLMLKDARSESRIESRSVEVKCNVTSETPSPKVIEAKEIETKYQTLKK
jgi:hypothetical protein